MNKELKELDEHLEEARKLVKQIEEKKRLLESNKNVRWRAKECNGNYEEYYILSLDGKICNQVDTNSECHTYRYSIGNYFKTREEAEKYKKHLLITQQLKDIALRLNDGVEIDWTNSNQKKYSICYSYHYVGGQLCQETFFNKYFYSNVIHCLSPKFLETAIKEIGEQELIEYIKGC